jgi:hypothetical protein
MDANSNVMQIFNKKLLAIVRPCKWLVVQAKLSYQRSFARYQGRHKKLAWFSVAVQTKYKRIICHGIVNLLTERSGQPIFYKRAGRGRGWRRKLSRHTDLSPETNLETDQLSVAVQIGKRRKSVLSR